jgi:hypothetical protein
MFHLVLPGTPEAVLAGAERVAASEKVELFKRVRGPGEQPGTSVIELVIGESAAAIPDDEAASLFAKVIA